MNQNKKITALRKVMHEANADLLAVAPGAHMDWLLGFYPHPDERPCLFCVSTSGAGFLMPTLNAKDVRARADQPMREWADDDGPDAALRALLSDLDAIGAKTLILDETMRADFALLLMRALPDAQVQFTEGTLGLLRMMKDADEYAALKDNAQINDRALMAGLEILRPGMTERELAAAIRAHYTIEGAEPVFGIIGASENGAFPHHSPGDRILREGDSIVVDIGGRKNGYSSDMTRMVALGQPPQGYAEVHSIVENAFQAALAAARPGVTAQEVDRAARSVIESAGYGDNFVHRTGHGMGLEVHEPPWITSTSDTVLREGMVFSIEPGIYLPDRFGVRLEDIVILRADGAEILSDLTRDLIVKEV